MISAPTSKKLLQTFHGIKTTIPPFWFMRQAGRYLPEYRQLRSHAGSFLELCYNPSLATEITLQPIRRFPVDAAILFSDILVVPHALGLHVDFLEHKGPIVETVTNDTELSKLDSSKVTTFLAPVYEAVSTIAAKLPSNVTLIGFAGSPWTVATYMIEGKSSKDFSLVKQLAYGKSDFFSKLINILIDATIMHLSAQIEAGAEVIQLFDSWAGILPEAAFRKWVIEPTTRIVYHLKNNYPHIPIIGFPRNAGINYQDYLETGVDAISIDYQLPLLWAKSHLQPHTIIQGNLDPSILLTDKETISNEICRILDMLGEQPFIFNLGHGMMPSIPIENVEHMINAIRNY